VKLVNATIWISQQLESFVDSYGFDEENLY